jgi:hypothetical protein
MKDITLKDALYNVDKSSPDEVYSESLTCLPYHLQEDPWLKLERMSSYFLVKWICTDTWVGTRVYYLDDKPVCVSTQTARKSDEKFNWVSQEAFDKVVEYVESLRDKSEYEVDTISNMDEVFKGYYTVDYGSELLVNEGYYKGKKVKVIKSYRRHEDIKKWRLLELDTGETITTGDFHIPLHLEEKEND